jgi:hypothetical protein
VLQLNENFFDITAKLVGIIFKKAELEDNFDLVYSKVFERMYEIEDFDGEFLSVLGEVGG